MRRLLCLSALLLSGWLADEVRAQAPANPAGPQTPQAAQAPAVRRDAAVRRSSTVRRSPYHRSYYDDASRSGFRNPGGVGRYEEYYPAGNRFQNEYARSAAPIVPTFNGSSGVPTFQDQIAAQQLGVQKYNAIQQSIDRYAQPYYGFGFFGGFR
jgi:hypothetical protein